MSHPDEDYELAWRMLHVRRIGRNQGVDLDDAVVTLLAVRSKDMEGVDIYTRGLIANSRMMGHELSFASAKAWLDS